MAAQVHVAAALQVTPLSTRGTPCNPRLKHCQSVASSSAAPVLLVLIKSAAVDFDHQQQKEESGTPGWAEGWDEAGQRTDVIDKVV